VTCDPKSTKFFCCFPDVSVLNISGALSVSSLLLCVCTFPALATGALTTSSLFAFTVLQGRHERLRFCLPPLSGSGAAALSVHASFAWSGNVVNGSVSVFCRSLRCFFVMSLVASSFFHFCVIADPASFLVLLYSFGFY
jgi:hypothetical protein